MGEPLPVVEVLPLAGASGFGYETTDDLVRALAARLPGYDVRVPPPRGQGGRGPDWWLEVERMLSVSVPWDSVVDTAVQAVANALAGWLRDVVRGRRARRERGEDRAETRPPRTFPAHAAPEEREELLRTTPYRVTLFGPRNQILATVEQDESMEEPVVTRHYRV